MGTRVTTIVAVAVALLGVAAIARADHDPAGNPYRLTVNYQGLHVRATAGSSTITRHVGDDRYVSSHGDASYPLLLHGRVPVEPGAKLLVVTDARWNKLSGRLVRLPATGDEVRYVGSLRVRRVAGKPRRWRVRLPQRLRGADVLDLQARGRGRGAYRTDNVNYWAGIRAP